MAEILHAVVLQTIRHSDRHNIVTLLTRERGRMALLSPAAAGKARSRSRNARLQPLALVEARVNVRNTRDLQILGDVATSVPLQYIYYDPLKGGIALFISEFLNALLRNSGPDEALFDYVADAIRTLDTLSRGIPNFHICFMVNLLPILGIQPDVRSWQQGAFFNMRDGDFSISTPLHNDFLTPDLARHIPLLNRMTFSNLSAFRLSGQTRSEIISLLLRYYSIHLPFNPNLKSLDILRQIFSV